MPNIDQGVVVKYRPVNIISAVEKDVPEEEEEEDVDSARKSED